MPHVFRCLWRPEEDIGSFGAGVIGGFELPAWVLGTELWSSGRAESILNI